MSERSEQNALPCEKYSNERLTYFQFKKLLQPSGWISPAYVGVDTSGNIQYLSQEPPQFAVAIEHVSGYAIPGFQNAHSHAFQYAMASRAEKHLSGSTDDFWSWREAMYACALSMDPYQMQAVAAMLYAEMLRKGYTHVAEFHYLHHDKNGKPYDNLSEMGVRLLEAAAIAGIKITLIPVFYQQGGFGKEPQPRQKRFISKTIEDYFHLLDDSANSIKKYPGARLGFSVHSLRAVAPEDIIETYQQGPKNIPFHLHAAEQLKEVDDCVGYLKQRPVEWLLNNLPLNERFHLVHCTHMDNDEVNRLAKSGAHAVLCQGTEGNLGDGIFRLTDFAAQNGSWSIGTDSHISLNPLEDLRWLDYAQRFTTHKRNTFDDGASILLNKTITAGRAAMGYKQSSYFEVGQPLDATIFNSKSPLLSSGDDAHLLSSIVYTSDSSDILGTMVNGKWVVKNQQHARGTAIQSDFVRSMKNLNF
jgi:formimidoylglutamate deiminase